MPELVDVLTHDGAGAGISSVGQLCQDQAKVYDAMIRKVQAAANQQGLSKELRDTGLQLVKDIEKQKASSEKAANWSRNLGKILDTIDVVSTFAKAAGYWYEGDRTGAIGVLVDDGIKKVTTGVLETAGSVVPGVGSMAGATVGEHIHGTYTGPAIEKQVDGVRDQAAKDKYLGANVPCQQVIESDGSVRTLAPNEYVDPETGNVRQRTPEEQKAYEDRYRQDVKDAAASVHPLDQARQDLASGKITQAEFDQIVRDYNSADPSKRHTRKPSPGEETDGEGEQGEGSKLRTPAATPPDGTGDEESEEEPPSTPAPAKPGILAFVTPTKLTAAGTVKEDYSSEEFANIVTTQFSMEFWNVGAMAPGYGTATLAFTATASLNGSTLKGGCSGTFSGGPNGTFSLQCEGGPAVLRLKDGQVVTLPQSKGWGGGKLQVRGSGAFADWPKGW